MIDFHMHSVFSDGENSISDMVSECNRLGYSAIALSDHSWNYESWLPRYLSEISSARKEYPGIRIFSSLESELVSLDSGMSVPKKDFSNFDFVIGSVHWIPSSLGRIWVSDDPKKTAFAVNKYGKELIFSSWEKAARTVIESDFNIIGHMLKVPYLIDVPVPYSLKEELVKMCVERDKIIEVNSAIPKDEEFMALLKEYDAMVSIGSDSHTVYALSQKFERNKSNFSELRHNAEKALSFLGIEHE
jgi:HisJ family histidinol phosphate phosphatase